MITTRKASDIAWKSKTVYHLLKSPPQPDTLAYEVEKSLEMRLSPRKSLQENFVLQYFQITCTGSEVESLQKLCMALRKISTEMFQL